MGIFTVFAQQNKTTIVFPKFKLLAMDSASFIENQQLKDSINTVFVNFSPQCDHCERTIKSIISNLTKFKNTQFVFTSFEEFSTIRKFYLDNALYSYTNIFVGQELNYELTKQIQYAGFPSVIMFDAHKNWVKSIHEETNAKAILKALKIK